MVKLSTQINQLEFPEKVGTPVLMELSPETVPKKRIIVQYEHNYGSIYQFSGDSFFDVWIFEWLCAIMMSHQ